METVIPRAKVIPKAKFTQCHPNNPEEGRMLLDMDPLLTPHSSPHTCNRRYCCLGLTDEAEIEERRLQRHVAVLVKLLS